MRVPRRRGAGAARGIGVGGVRRLPSTCAERMPPYAEVAARPPGRPNRPDGAGRCGGRGRDLLS
ncbi:MAG TPA: hypothetical protein VFU43_21480 [Streptosporangiaceae bacterium]|nr:hypothetical protein [Streptosporangiaceae bacterium]